ncbi:MAG TPA: SURF1 family protein [Acetobacteraceae bacterium]|nr:SURF1 family protein [Acetobacteraceae bacterium]
MLVPALMTALMLGILLALGTWQVERLAWKRAILARIDAAERAAPVPLPADPGPFEKVAVRGHFLGGPEATYGVEVRDAPGGQAMGGQVIAPFRTDDGRTILIDRGWAPTPPPPPAGEQDITGYARAPEHPWVFGAADDPAKRQFFTLDPARIGAALGLDHVAPFVLVALGPQPAFGVFPEPAQHLPRPPNNHLSYAITWYGLALGLIVVFVIWARGRLAER